MRYTGPGLRVVPGPLLTMTLSTGMSCCMAALLSIVTVAVMNLCGDLLSSSKGLTIFGGFLGSVLFLLLITMVNNAECLVFGEGFQSGLFPEVIFCLSLSVFISSFIHGVCGTTW
ncbi:Keratinocyte-associated protein 2 protein [Fasciola hepatica]|uniref:Keratinocyte-associated protein 2 protein n=1 Tax=Fasciola hepatica TaxID=6192 RepID=A0A2H1BR86_FASHE|nr:Keratinocyte-associated protein 2 protein [Fasciola hepatica]